MNVGRLLQAIRREAEDLAEEMPFRDYLDRVRRDPRRARLSHALIHDMILAAGVTAGPDGKRRYELFHGELFGADEVIRHVVEYFAAAARRLEVRKRILLLVGPPGSGKSTLVNAMKRGLEEYTRTAEGAVYAIKGCPVHEEPLHLIPPNRRGELPGVYVEGDLCPHCRWMVGEVYDGDVARVPALRVAFSAADGVGIGTFVATDPRSEDLSRLVGQVDVSRLREGDPQSAREAFRLDGELNAANRGLADLIEVFKMDERFLSVLLTLSQEQVLKLSGPGVMYADEAIVAHSNLAEYDSLVADPKAAALLDRLMVVKIGYVLAVRDEVRVYEKMLRQTDLGETHVSPLALPAAATLAVLTRLAPHRWAGWTAQKKLRLYDGRFVPDAGPEDLEALRDAAPEEGFSGASPRFVVNHLSTLLGRSPGCLGGLVLLETLWEGLTQRAGFREQDRESWSDLFAAARAEYDEMVIRAVRRAMVPGFDQAAAAVARDVLGELERWSRGADEADLRTLRQVERALGVTAHRRVALRQSVMAALRAARAWGQDALHLADPRLEEALDRHLLPPWPQGAAILGRPEVTESVRRARAELRERLVDEGGFCELCADDVVDYAAQLARPRRERRTVPRALRWLVG